jgi:hypothetical protein
MKAKPILCPQRLRQVPAQFSWIDQRLVRQGHITRCGPNALALYLLLVSVGDAQGLSYYSDGTAARLLSLSASQLPEARAQLLGAGLIAYRAPFYQVLSLDPAPVAAALTPPTQRPSGSEPRSSQARSVGEILRQMMDEPTPPSSSHD